MTLTPEDKVYGDDSDPTAIAGELIYRAVDAKAPYITSATSQAIAPTQESAFGAHSVLPNNGPFRLNFEIRSLDGSTIDQTVNNDYATDARVIEDQGGALVRYQLKESPTSYPAEIKDRIKALKAVWEGRLVNGGKYWVGDVRGTLLSRTEEVWPTATTIDATFQRLEPAGTSLLRSPNESGNGNEVLVPHICKRSEAKYTTTRAVDMVDLCLQSNVWSQLSGFTHWNSIPNPFQLLAIEQAGELYFQMQTLNAIRTGAPYPQRQSKPLPLSTIKVSGYYNRFSFFTVSVRELGNEPWQSALPGSHVFAVRGNAPKNAFNYVKLAFPSAKRWQVRLDGIPPWQVINSGKTVCVVNAALAGVERRTAYLSSGPLICQWNGYTQGSDWHLYDDPTFQALWMVAFFGSTEVGYGQRAVYGAMHSRFEQFTNSSEDGPEHQLVAVNEYTRESTQPPFTRINLLGLNLFASESRSSISTVSVPVLEGRLTYRVGIDDPEDPPTVASSYLPDIVYSICLDEEAGVGKTIPVSMLNLDDLIKARAFVVARGYHWDSVHDTRIGLDDWLDRDAWASLLQWGNNNGKRSLLPLVPTDEDGLVVETPTVQYYFTDDDLDDVEVRRYSWADIRPQQITVRYRQTDEETGFDQTRAIALTWADEAMGTHEPVTFDYAAHLCSRQQALDFASWYMRQRRYNKRSLSFSTPLIQLALAPGEVIGLKTKEAMDTHWLIDEIILGEGLIMQVLATEYPLSDTGEPLIKLGDLDEFEVEE